MKRGFMMFCSNCGNPLNEGQSFCSRCGAPVHEVSPPAPYPQQAYPRPSYPEPAYQQGPYPQPPLQPEKKTKSTVLAVIAAVVCAAVLIGCGGLVLARPWQTKLTTAHAFRQYGKFLEESKEGIQDYASGYEIPPVAIYDINGSGITDLVFVERDPQDGKLKVRVAVDHDNRIVRHTTENIEHFILFITPSDGSLYRYSSDGSTESYSRLSPDNGGTIEKFVRMTDGSSDGATYAYYPDGVSEQKDSAAAKNAFEQLVDRLNDEQKDVIVTDCGTDEIDELFGDKKEIASVAYNDAVDIVSGDEDEDTDSATADSKKKEKKKTDKAATSDERSRETVKPTEPKPTEAPREDVFDRFAGSYIFTSGAGAWGSSLELNADGSFTGSYHDSNMGERGDGYQSTMYLSEFSGSFKNPKKINDYTYYFELEDIRYEREPGEQELRDDGNDHFTMLFYTEAAGLKDAEKGIYAYTADAPWSELPEDFINWSRGLIGREISDNRLGRNCLYVIEPKSPWFGEKE